MSAFTHEYIYALSVVRLSAAMLTRLRYDMAGTPSSSTLHDKLLLSVLVPFESLHPPMGPKRYLKWAHFDGCGVKIIILVPFSSNLVERRAVEHKLRVVRVLL